MTNEERAGRRITIAIAWLAAAPPVLLLTVLLASGVPVLKATVITQGAVPIVLSWLLVQGRGWVRALVVVAFALDAVSALVELLRLEWSLETLLLVSTRAVVHGLAAIVLVASPQVRAFFAYQNRFSRLDLTGA